MSIYVLWVEDEPDSFRYESRLVEETSGWQITFVQIASEAVELIRNTAFDVVVVDLFLPRNRFELQNGILNTKAGRQLIDTIQNPDRTGRTPPNVPLMVISANVSPIEEEGIVRKLISTDYYLTKPLVLEDFMKVVKKITQTAKTHIARGSE